MFPAIKRTSAYLTRSFAPFCNAPKPPADQKSPEIGPKQFSQIDIRVGQILYCWKHPESQNLYCEKVRISTKPEVVVEIASGLQKFVPISSMKGNVLVMVNLKPRKLAGFQSNGMLVCASKQDKSFIEMLVPQGQVGERVFLENYEELFSANENGKFLPVLNPKKKILQRCLEHFRTDQNGNVIWKEIKLRTQLGNIKSSIIKGLVS